MRLARVIVATHLQLSPHRPPTPVPIRRDSIIATTRRPPRRGCGHSSVGVGVLGGGGGVGSAAQQLGAVGGVLGVLARALEAVEARAEVGQLGAEIADPVVRLLLLRRVQLLPRQRRVLVQRAREGRQRRRDGPQRRGRRLVAIVGGRGQVREVSL